MKKSCVIFFLTSLICSANALLGKFNSDKLFLTNIHLKQGLSQCVVTDMVIDKKGFIWAGTFDGLNRFDGSSFKIFRNNPENPKSIESSKINKLFADNNSHIYLATNLGISIFNTKTVKREQDDFIKSIKPTWICNEDDFHVWMTTKNNTLILVDTRNFTIVAKYNNPIQLKCAIQELINTGDRIYQLTLCGEIIVFDKITKKITILKSEKIRGNVVCANVDKFNNLIISSNEAGLIELNTKTNEFKVPSFLSENTRMIGINKIIYNAKSNILLFSSYGQGLFVFDYDANKLHQLKKNVPPLSLSANYPISMTTNEEGIIFLGYDGMGIDLIDPNIKKFIPIYKDDPNDYETLKFVRKIVEGNNGNLFFGTSGSGLVKYNEPSKQFSFYHMKTKFSLAENFVIEMLRFHDQLWLGYNGGGVEIVDINTIRSVHQFDIGKSNTSLSNGVIWSFLEDKNHNIWIGTRENGINKINPKTLEVKQFDTVNHPYFAINGIRCLFEDKQNHILIGTEKGLFQLNLLDDKIIQVFPKESNVKTKSFESIKCIYEDYLNRLWLGTDGGGIVVLGKNFEILKEINTNNYLNSNVVYSILPQSKNSFWISSNSGLSKIDWTAESFNSKGIIQVANFDESNGLQSNEFNTGAYAKLKDGRLAFGGLNGVNIFNGLDIYSNPSIPDVYLNEFKIFENDLESDVDISYANDINLKHFENSISLSFNTLAFTKPEKIKYRYRLIGYDKEWINANNRNYISYTNLPSGSYEFQVKASNYDGIWGSEYKSLKIFIATPFYRTWWFLVLSILTFSQILYWIYKYRMNQIKEKENLRIEYNKELAEVEMKALRAQINPHFLFNSLNSINNYILKNDTKMATKYLVKFSQLVRRILNNSSTPYISLLEEIQTIELYMLIEGMRFNNQFGYSIEVKDDINTNDILIPSLLLQPYVENAIWHGLLHKEGVKHIYIVISKFNNDIVRITIEDNGVGREKSAELERTPKNREAFGMKLGENRLRLMNQNNQLEVNAKVNVVDLQDEDYKSKGTQIVIDIPTKTIIKSSFNLN